MKYEFSLDLRVARRRSGLTQADCAYLLGIDPTRISKLEAGTTLPTALELSILFLIFEDSAEHMLQNIALYFGHFLKERLRRMPDAPRNWKDTRSRDKTLAVVRERLDALEKGEYA